MSRRWPKASAASSPGIRQDQGLPDRPRSLVGLARGGPAVGVFTAEDAVPLPPIPAKAGTRAITDTALSSVSPRGEAARLNMRQRGSEISVSSISLPHRLIGEFLAPAAGFRPILASHLGATLPLPWQPLRPPACGFFDVVAGAGEAEAHPGIAVDRVEIRPGVTATPGFRANRRRQNSPLIGGSAPENIDHRDRTRPLAGRGA